MAQALVGRSVFLTLLAMTTLVGVAPAQQLTGKGEWQSLAGEAMRGTWSVSLSRRRGHIEGSLNLTGSNLFVGGPVAGDIDASSIVLGVLVDGAKQATFKGILDGDSVKGEWDCDVIADHGVWYGTLSAEKSARDAATGD